MIVIDTRSQAEFEQEHVEGAVWFDVMRMAGGEMPDVSKDEEIILYCRSGARSTTAMHIMKANGFTYVTSAGGLGQMAARGFKVVR